jgi:aminopeptidase N
VNKLETALLRGATWVTLWDQLLEGRLAPNEFLQSALDSLAIEQDELVVSRILSYTRTVYWNYLSNSDRQRLSGEIENLLWTQAMSERPRSGRSSFYSAYRSLTTTDEGLARLQRLWSGDEQVTDLPLSELEQISLASGLAIKGIANAEEILTLQQERLENPDRLARFKFVRDSLSADPLVRAAFFESLKLESNRDREAWVIAGLNNIHHPLRAQESIALIAPALNMIGEIQETGDIFFPGRWLDSTLRGHNSVEAAKTIREFLETAPDLSPRLRLKVQQSADSVFRAAHLVNGWNAS